MTIAGILGLLTMLKPFLAPLLAALGGWLFPSPLQRAQKGIGDASAEVKAVEDSRGDFSSVKSDAD